MNAESAGGKVFDEEIDDAIDGTRKVRVGNVSQRKRLYVVWRRNGQTGIGGRNETNPECELEKTSPGGALEGEEPGTRFFGDPFLEWKQLHIWGLLHVKKFCSPY